VKKVTSLAERQSEGEFKLEHSLKTNNFEPNNIQQATRRRHRFGRLVTASVLIMGFPKAVSGKDSVNSICKNVPGITLRLEHTIPAPPEAVFHAWIDPDAIKQWFVYDVAAHWRPEPEVEAKPGGRFSWSVVRDADSAAFRFRGTYREIKTPEKLVFTWEWESLPIPGVESPGKTIVTLDLLEEGAVTRLILTQTGFPNEAAREAHRKGWERCLDGIVNLLTSGQKETPNAAQPFIRVQANVIALEHVRVIDGTGAEPTQDQTILISDGKIAALGTAGSIQIPTGVLRISLPGYTAIPGLVGMHDHLFYSANFFRSDGILAYSMPFSYPRLYLASGVTTIRTTGSFEPYTDLEIKKAVDAGTLIGPKMNVTGPYLEGEPLPLIQIHKLTGPEDARRTVDFWAEEGAGSFKVFQNITREELTAAIEAAHKHGLTITGHLCSVGFREAAEMGIDNLEHGLTVDNEFVPGKQPDKCPRGSIAEAPDLEIEGAEIQALIKTLVSRHVAITSTLPVFEEELIPTRPDASQRVLDALSDSVRKMYQEDRHARRAAMEEGARTAQGRAFQRDALMLKKEMEFERAFVRAGGLLMAGSDGVLGGDVAGFGDQRELELLVEAGFTPVEAVKIATLNGAIFLKQADRIGSLAVGKQADIALVKGDPSKSVQEIENVEIVFKDGVGFDSKKLIDSVKGQVGIH
jgi:imidazolonepropionase-like amidohydrolase/uncharacterized protein YndB with AHSA1/START domain